MERTDHESQTWLAELNRRILAGRPVAAAELSVLEDAYAAVSDTWGPPGAQPPTLASSPRAQRPRIIVAERQ